MCLRRSACYGKFEPLLYPPLRSTGTAVAQSDQDLFGLDSFAVSSFGLLYGITDKLYVSAYRSPILPTRTV